MIQKILVALLLLAFAGHSLRLFEEHDNTGVVNGSIIAIDAGLANFLVAC